jgi:steroid 5-alpha reductase family enzyme
MRIKQSRALSFIAVAIIYIICTLVGLGQYGYLPFSTPINLLIADTVATIVCFIFSLIFKNSSVYDPYWSVAPIVIVIGYAIVNGLNALGIVLLVAVCYWGIRLTANWAYTFKGLTHQDWRYTMLCEKTGKFYPIINFIGIHYVPTLVVYGCILPAVMVIENKPEINVLSIIFACVSVAAATMQGVADIQMHKYRKNKTTSFIRNGLWRNSRHPNYLGEILMWWGIGLSAVCAMPNMWYLIFGAVANTVLFLSVSIPMADGRQSRKEGFVQYKAETRMLLPIRKFK